ncbi:MAG: protein kinase domain-containing protein, partial [Kofleriaceae bacterium]
LVLNIVAQSCAGLHYAHERVMNGKPLNIVHRDISPQNLVISFEGVVKVVDFGIAKAELRETRTRSGTIKGKFAYMSPEQCVANNVDRRTDVFALGVITHELLTGRRLFKKPSPYETYQAVIECAVEPPSKINHELDPALDAIVMRAIQKDKDARYATAEEFGDAILGYLHHRGKGSGPGDVSRFFEASFGQEIDEHGARMRELISGRDFSVDTGINWDGEEDAKRNQTVDLSGGRSVPLDTADLLDVERPSSAGLSDLIQELGDVPAPADGEDLPAEKTRIESNPLERLNELEAELEAARAKATAKSQAARKTGPQATAKGAPKTGPQAAAKSGPHGVARSGQTPAPQHAMQPASARPEMPPSGPLRLPAPPTVSLQAMQNAKKFPDAANLPTMIAEPDEEESPRPAAPPGLARPAQGGQPMGPRGSVDPNARTAMDMRAPEFSQPPAHGAQPPAHGAQPPGQPGARGPAPRQAGPASATMSAAPLQPIPPGPPGPPPQQPPARPSLQLGPNGYPVMNAQMSAQMASGATVFPSDLGGGPNDAQRAADLASPVGPGYPEGVDWAAAAATPARALPPWLLAVLFVGALGAALLVTILVAKALR